MKRKEEN